MVQHGICVLQKTCINKELKSYEIQIFFKFSDPPPSFSNNTHYRRLAPLFDVQHLIKNPTSSNTH